MSTKQSGENTNGGRAKGAKGANAELVTMIRSIDNNGQQTHAMMTEMMKMMTNMQTTMMSEITQLKEQNETMKNEIQELTGRLQVAESTSEPKKKTRKKKVKKARKPGPARAKNAYMFFLAERRDDIGNELTDIAKADDATDEQKKMLTQKGTVRVSEIAKRAGEEWKEMSEDDKARYKEMSENDKKEKTRQFQEEQAESEAESENSDEDGGAAAAAVDRWTLGDGAIPSSMMNNE